MGIFKSIYTTAVLKPLAGYLQDVAKSDLQKGDSMNAVLRDRLPFSNPYPTARKKPGGGVSFDTLRRFSTQYDVARAAINRRKRQLNGLEWSIVAAEEDDETDYTQVTRQLRKEFNNIGGYKVRFREFIDTMVEDLLVLDALALYKRPNMGGGLYGLQPVDAATIVLEVGEDGGTPMPPEVAYKQIIRGEKVAEFTADEMYYEMLNPRTYTPYGLSPMETLIIGISTALKSDIYNLHMLTEGNIPEGFFGVPEAWTPDQIKEFQTLWDAALAGDTRATSKLKFVPSGKGATGYSPALKPEDMKYKELQSWLMQKTCMLFEIQPNELGFTDDVNKSVGEVQQNIGLNSGLIPLARFFEEIFTDVIQQDMGYENLKFKYTGLDFTDEKRDAEVAAIKINSGQTTVDEVRRERGQKPLGVDKPFVIGSPTFIDEDSQKTRQAAAEALISMGGSKSDDEEEEPAPKEDDAEEEEQPEAKKSAEETHIQLVSELRAFRKYAMNRVKQGKKLRRFESEVLPAHVVDEMNTRLAKAADADQVRDLFTEYMQDYQIDFLADSINLKKSLHKLL